ncbi:hypothetical protein [Mycobacterium sp. MMS18-G62]
MDDANRNTLKLFAAVIGGSALIAMGAVSAIVLHEAGPANAAKSTTMTVGSTSTETTPPTVEATTMAAPGVKGPAPLPSEEAGPAAP